MTSENEWVVGEMQKRIAKYDDYKYCDEFLGNMREVAGEVLSRLLEDGISPDKALSMFEQYVYGVCVGLETSDGHAEDIIWPIPLSDPADIAEEVKYVEVESERYARHRVRFSDCADV